MTAPEREMLRAAAGRAGELFAAYYEELEQRRVDPGCDRDRLRAWFDGSLGEQGVGLEGALRDFEEQVLPSSMATPHPCYFGLVNSSPLPAGPLADLLVSTINNNAGSYHQSPAASCAEAEVVRLFAALLGLPAAPEATVGMVLPGGTYANLQGLLLARAAACPGARADGAASFGGSPAVYTSAASHFSVARAAQVIGIGERNVVALPTVGRGAMDTAALRARLRADVAQARVPVAVVATLGTTGTGAVDPLAEIAAVCRDAGVWLHVDACYGGAAALLEELRPLCAGLEHADSVAVDAHKWFFAPIAAGLLLTRHADVARAAFDLEASYIPHARPDDAFLRGLPTSRRSSGLTVWMALRAHGLRAVRDAVARNCALARRLEQRLAARGLTVLPGGQLSIACARLEPLGLSPERTDSLQRDLAAAAIATGATWFATFRHDDRTWLRFNLVNLHTRERHVDAVADLVADLGRRLL